jgi:hypothetical protein
MAHFLIQVALVVVVLCLGRLWLGSLSVVDTGDDVLLRLRVSSCRPRLLSLLPLLYLISLCSTHLSNIQGLC